MLMNRETAKLVNTIIAIASPIDQPVLNIDFFTEAFYRKSNKLWLEHRPPNQNPITNLTNTCCNASNFIELEPSSHDEKTDLSTSDAKRYFLDDILFITVGGGSRDLLVHSGLTSSQFSDIHVMSSCIPGVWLTTDHLASVWCLQQVLVINRFLYSIILPVSHRHRTHDNAFVSDKSIRLANAKYHLTVRHIINLWICVTHKILLNLKYSWIFWLYSTARHHSTKEQAWCFTFQKYWPNRWMGRR